MNIDYEIVLSLEIQRVLRFWYDDFAILIFNKNQKIMLINFGNVIFKEKCLLKDSPGRSQGI